MTNLTPIQQKLVNELIKEFTKINPKPSDNGASRFGFNTISECNKEEERFKATITKHNLTMMKVFLNQLDADIKEFKKEFGKVLNIQFGYKNGNTTYHDIDTLTSTTKDKPLNFNYNEIYLFLVSKTKTYYDGSRINSQGECNGKAFKKLYVGFKYENVKHKLESGKELSFVKIVGLLYSTYDYNSRDKWGVTKSTLDELIQSCKSTQQEIVRLADIK